jgi:hypothetical protein
MIYMYASSRYSCFFFSESYSSNSQKLRWIATPVEKLTPMSEKSFINTVGLGWSRCLVF